jgi:phospholipid/cholesterol/gamma-HCH transport system ATP-binding protein
MPSMLELSDMAYVTPDGLRVLSHVSFSLAQGELLVVAGRSGSGRTTLLDLCAGLTAPTSGMVCWDGTDIAKLPRETVLSARKKIGFAFQVHALISNMTVFDNIALPLRYHTGSTEQDIRIQVESQLRLFGLTGVATAYPESLSVREQKSVAFIRAFILEPDLVFLDEPGAGLDDVSEREMIQVLVEMRSRRPITTVVVTNETRIMNALEGRTAVLNGGRVSLHESGTLSSEQIVQMLEGAYEQTRIA